MSFKHGDKSLADDYRAAANDPDGRVAALRIPGGAYFSRTMTTNISQFIAVCFSTRVASGRVCSYRTYAYVDDMPVAQ